MLELKVNTSVTFYAQGGSWGHLTLKVGIDATIRIGDIETAYTWGEPWYNLIFSLGLVRKIKNLSITEQSINESWRHITTDGISLFNLSLIIGFFWLLYSIHKVLWLNIMTFSSKSQTRCAIDYESKAFVMVSTNMDCRKYEPQMIPHMDVCFGVSKGPHLSLNSGTTTLILRTQLNLEPLMVLVFCALGFASL